jgi:hypothetical protein
MPRYLVIINYDGSHDPLVQRLRSLAGFGESRFHIVVPAVIGSGMHTEGGEHASAARRLASIAAALAGLAGVDGEIGADNVYTAISDALREQPYDHILVATPPLGRLARSRLVRRLTRIYGVPAMQVAVPDARWLQHHPLVVGAPEEREVS